MKKQHTISTSERCYTPPLCEILLVRQERNILLSGDPEYTIPDVEEEDLEWEDA
ncbi:MAG: hypothetical protein J6W09_08130 [Bacteroidales bacterium]|nr:hypothetical protein [Bacteroidales bacterium]